MAGVFFCVCAVGRGGLGSFKTPRRAAPRRAAPAPPRYRHSDHLARRLAAGGGRDADADAAARSSPLPSPPQSRHLPTLPPRDGGPLTRARACACAQCECNPPGPVRVSPNRCMSRMGPRGGGGGGATQQQADCCAAATRRRSSAAARASARALLRPPNPTALTGSPSTARPPWPP